MTVLGDASRGKTRRAEDEIRSDKRRGPLHGLPFAVNDNYAARGARMAVKSRLYLDYTPKEDATAVQLEEAGAIPLGKLRQSQLLLFRPHARAPPVALVQPKHKSGLTKRRNRNSYAKRGVSPR
jgi:Asp-tRNA(Asn)/Glu-tRNA(Gln) amidotransferase A subunit family amidase